MITSTQDNMYDIASSLAGKAADLLKKHSVKWIIVGLSGGADSVALLRIILECRKIIPDLHIEAIHCNFHLRGDESVRDEKFCLDLCRHLNVKLDVVNFNTAEYSKRNKLSIETACRNLRYDYFRRKLTDLYHIENAQVISRCARIAVAHNSDDQAETVLLNLFRGAGVRGLGGMKTDTGEILRPLLNTSRAEILQYLAAIGQDFIVDSSNLSSDYRRNFIRNEILPLIESRWGSVKRRLNASAEIMRQQEIENHRLETDYGIGKNFLGYDGIHSSETGKWPVFRFVDIAGGSPSIAEEIWKFINRRRFHLQSGKWWRMPDGKRIVAERDGLHLVSERPSEFSIEVDEYHLDKDLMNKIKKSSNDEFWTPLSPEKIEFRHRHDGDRMMPLGMNGKSRLVSDIMNDARLSTLAKEEAVIAVDIRSEDILWVEGLKRSALHLISNDETIVYRYKVKRDLKAEL